MPRRWRPRLRASCRMARSGHGGAGPSGGCWRSESRSLPQAGGSSGSVRLSVRIGAVARCRSQVVSKPRGISARSLRTRVSPARAGRLPMAACSRLSTNGATSRSTTSPPGSAGRSRGTALRRSARVTPKRLASPPTERGCCTSGIRARKRSPSRPNGPPSSGASPFEAASHALLWSDTGNNELVLKHWSGDDGTILVNEWRAEQRSRLVVVDLATSTIRAIHPIGTTSPYGASLSPDAVHIVYDKPDPATRLRDIYIAGVGEAQEIPLIRDASSDHSPMWTRDGRFVLFLSDRSGPTSLWAQRVEGARPIGRPVRVEPNLGWASPMGETADGAYFFRRQMGTRDVYIVDLDQNGVITSEPMRASSEVVGANGSSDWSPDGKQLTFFRRRDDRWSLVVKSIAEPREREINDPNLVGHRPASLGARRDIHSLQIHVSGSAGVAARRFADRRDLDGHSQVHRPLQSHPAQPRADLRDQPALVLPTRSCLGRLDARPQQSIRPGRRSAWRSRPGANAWPTPRATGGSSSCFGSSIWRAPGASARSFVRAQTSSSMRTRGRATGAKCSSNARSGRRARRRATRPASGRWMWRLAPHVGWG